MKILISLFALLIAVSSSAQVGDAFPEMEGESLSNKMVTIPGDVSGKYTLIGLAFSKKSEKYLNSWFSPAYNQFIYKPETPSLFAANYDVNVYFIPMFTGAKRPAYEKVMKKVSETIDERLYPHVLFYKGTLKEYKKSLNFDGKDLPYFYILDPKGKIIYTTSGQYSENKMRTITDMLDEASN